MTDAPRHYHALDGLRGLSALMVVIFHGPFNSHLRGHPLIANGWLFVDFFFVLSGFIIAEKYGQQLRSPPQLARFIWLRLGRLYPLHLAVLGAFLAYELLWLAAGGSALTASREAFAGAMEPGGLLLSLLLLHSFGLSEQLVWNGPSWSIGAEFFSYLLFAALCLLLGAKGRRAIGFAMLVLGVAALAASLMLGPFSEQTANGFARCVAGFAAGACISLLRAPRPSVGTKLESAMVLGIGTFIAYAPPQSHYLAPILFVAAVAVFAEERGVLSRAMASAPMRWLGMLSFSIYMTHVFILQLFANAVTIAERLLGLTLRTPAADGSAQLLGSERWQGDVGLLLFLAAVLLVSAATYRWIERPARDWSRRKWPLRDAPTHEGQALAQLGDEATSRRDVSAQTMPAIASTAPAKASGVQA